MKRLTLGVCVLILSFTLGHHASRENFVLGETITHVATNRDPSNQQDMYKPTEDILKRYEHGFSVFRENESSFCFVTTINFHVLLLFVVKFILITLPLLSYFIVVEGLSRRDKRQPITNFNATTIKEDRYLRL